MPTIPIRWSDNTKELAANLKQGLNQIEATKASAEKMARALGGDNLIRAAHSYVAAVQQVGGANRLTAAEQERVNALLQKALDKYAALGKTAPQAMKDLSAELAKLRKEAEGNTTIFGKAQSALGAVGISAGALGVGSVAAALTAGAKAAMAYADSLTKLSDRTGIGVVELQRLGAVAAASGNDIDQIAGAVNTFQKRLVEDSDATTAALSRIGLTVDELRALSPDEQFFAIARGVAAIKDPAEQTRTAMDLFGKSGAEILPTLKADVDSLKDSTFQMSEASVKALDDFGDKLDAFGTSAVNVLGEVAGAAIIAATKIVELAGALPANAGPAPGTPLPASGLIQIDAAKEKVKEFTGEVTFMGKVVRASSVGVVQGFTHGADAVDAIHAAFREYAETVQTRVNAALKASAQRWKELEDASHPYTQTLAEINVGTRDIILNLAAMGGDVRKLGAEYGLTAAQADALAQEIRMESLIAAAAASVHAKLATEVYNVDRAFEKLQGRPLTKIPALESGPNAQLEALNKVDDFGRKIDGAAQAFAILAQVSGDTFGGMSQQIGQIVSQMNALQQSAQAFGVNLTNVNAGIITLGLNVIGYLAQAQAAEDAMDDAVASVHFNALLQYAEEASRLLGTDVANAYLDAIGHAKDLAEAQRRVNELVAAMAAQQSLINDATAAVGPSQTQLDEAATRAREVLDYVMTAGQRMKDGTFIPDYTPEQQAKAYYDWQKAMAAAGNQAAKAWVEAHDAAENGGKAASKAIDELKAKRDGLAQSIANEAPEEVMGVIEAQIRGQIAALDAQMEAQQTSVDANTDQATEAAATIEDEFKNCWVKVGDDAEAAADLVRGAFSDLDVVVKVRYDVPEFNGGSTQPQPVARGGRVGSTGVQYFSVGRLPSLPLFRPIGTDTVPAMLTPGEMVLTESQQRAVSALMAKGGASSGGDGGVTIGTLSVRMSVTDNVDQRRLAADFKEALRTDATLYEAVAVVARRAVV